MEGGEANVAAKVLYMNATELDLPVLFWCSDYARENNENINK